jgi:hypothetical protein
MTSPRVALVLALAPVVGCANPLARGESQFTDGHYPDAKQTFMSLEGDSRSYTDAKRAEYALYRGLTLAALGDKAQAGVWLREAEAIEYSHPGSLSHEDAQRLKMGIEGNGGQ